MSLPQLPTTRGPRSYLGKRSFVKQQFFYNNFTRNMNRSRTKIFNQCMKPLFKTEKPKINTFRPAPIKRSFYAPKFNPAPYRFHNIRMPKFKH